MKGSDDVEKSPFTVYEAEDNSDDNSNDFITIIDSISNEGETDMQSRMSMSSDMSVKTFDISKENSSHKVVTLH